MALPAGGPWTPVLGLLVVGVFFPALIFWGAAATERHPAIGAAFGDASYALYAIHRPLLYIVVWLLAVNNLSSMSKPHAMAIQAVIMIFIGILAWGVNRLFTTAKRQAR